MDGNNSDLSPLLKNVHGFFSRVVSQALFYPLDVAQALIQVGADDARDNAFQTLIHLYKSYGISSWYRGFLPSTISINAAIFGNFLSIAGKRRKGIQTGSFLGGLVDYGTTQVVLVGFLPLQVAKVRMITSPSKYKNTLECIETIFNEEGPSALFRGFSASLLAWIPHVIGRYIFHELFYKLFARPPQGMVENIAVGVSVHLLSGLLEYPILTAEAVRQSQLGEPDSVVKILLRTYKKEGLKGLYPGFSCIVYKTPRIVVSSFIARKSKALFLRLSNKNIVI